MSRSMVEDNIGGRQPTIVSSALCNSTSSRGLEVVVRQTRRNSNTSIVVVLN